MKPIDKIIKMRYVFRFFFIHHYVILKALNLSARYKYFHASIVHKIVIQDNGLQNYVKISLFCVYPSALQFCIKILLQYYRKWIPKTIICEIIA